MPFFSKKYIPILIFLLSFAIYIYSLCPQNPAYGDSDEIITTSILLGVPHPSGYPLSVIITKFFTLLPIPFSPAFKANLSSAFLHSLTLVFFYYAVLKFLEIIYPQKNSKLKILVATTATFILAFSAYFWLYSTTTEVFPLNNLLITITLFFTLSLYLSPKNLKLFYYLALSIGLGVSHHQTFILILPAIIFLLFSKLKSNLKLSHYLYFFLIFFLSYLLPNLVLIFLNNNHADLSWYFEPNLKGWLSHVFRQDYSKFNLEQLGFTHQYLNSNFLGAGKISRSLFLYFKSLVEHFTLIPVIAIFFSLFLLFRHHKKIFFPFLLLFLIPGPLFAIYMSTPDIGNISFNINFGVTQRLYLFSEIILTFLFSISLYYIFSFTLQKIKVLKKSLLFSIFVALIFVLTLFIKNFPLGFQKNNYIGHDYAHSILSSAKPNSLIVCMSDFACYALFYAQKVEGQRPDLDIISKSTQVNHYFISKKPDLFGFDYLETPHHLTDIISWNLDKRNVYLTDITDIYNKYLGLEANPFFVIPDNYLYLIVKKVPQNLPQVQDYSLSYQLIDFPTPQTNYFLKSHKTYFAYSHNITAKYFLKLGNLDLAKENFKLASLLDPQFQEPRLFLNQISAKPNSIPPYNQMESSSSADFVALSHQNFENKQFDLAYSNLLKATYIEPLNLNSRLELARFFQKGNFRYQAKREFLHILKYYPENLEAQQELSKYLDIDLEKKSPDKYLVL